MRKVASNIVRRFQANMLYKLSNDFGIGMAGLGQFSGGAAQAQYQQYLLEQQQKQQQQQQRRPATKSDPRIAARQKSKQPVRPASK